MGGISVRKITGTRFAGWEWELQDRHKDDRNSHPKILSSLSSLSVLSDSDKTDNTHNNDKKNCGGVDVGVESATFLHGENEPANIAEIEL